MSEMHMDFMFIGQEGEPGVTVPALVVRDRSTRMTLAAVVPTEIAAQLSKWVARL